MKHFAHKLSKYNKPGEHDFCFSTFLLSRHCSFSGAQNHIAYTYNQKQHECWQHKRQKTEAKRLNITLVADPTKLMQIYKTSSEGMLPNVDNSQD